MPNGYRLLVVEDDSILCESIAEALRFMGYEVSTARDGDTALEVLRGEPRPDAIVMDVVLPRTTADRLLHRIDAALGPHPPVVLMTGMVPRPAGAPPDEEVLVKPFELDDLLARVARACGAALDPGLRALP